jgi:hypothetical protein
MPSSYTNLGIQKMATGEKAGTWGTLTNTNWDMIENIAGGYTTQALSDGGTVTLTKNDGSESVLSTRIIKLTGTLSSGNAIVTVPDSIEAWWLVNNAEGGSSYTVTFKTVSGTGVAWAAGVTGTKLIYTDGTNCIDASADFGSVAGSTTQLQYNNAGAFGGASGLTTDGTNLNILAQGDLRLQDSSGGEYVAHQAAADTTTYTVTWPGAVATSNDQILTSTTGGVLSWVDNSGGTSWQAVETGATMTAVAGNGYFIDTTSNACNATMPSGSLGDEVTYVDYAATFDTNNLTVTPASGEKIQGASADATLTVAIERAGFTLVYSGATQGWLLKDK